MKNKKTNIIVGLLRIGASLQREGDRIVKAFSINQQQYVVLNHIYYNQPISQDKICSGLLFEKSNISKILKKLVELQYVHQSTSQQDKRSLVIVCTIKGEDIIKKGNILFGKYNSELLEQYSDSEIAAIEAFINSFQMKFL
jgi:DNA-binding MarR family transcriptional regulator